MLHFLRQFSMTIGDFLVPLSQLLEPVLDIGTQREEEQSRDVGVIFWLPGVPNAHKSGLVCWGWHPQDVFYLPFREGRYFI